MMGKIIFVSLVIVHCSFSQWSTSPYTQDALWVCPGFNQGILTFDDGSSIIYGILSDNLYVQKLDPYGYKMWQAPIEVFNTPGTNASGGVAMISDGEGGVFLGWADHRGAEQGQFGYFNNAIYMQYVDKNGQKKWQEGGIQIAPVEGGIKGGGGVADGQGGVVLCMKESDFLRTGASKKERTWSVGYNAYGQKKWEHKIDSSTIQYSLSIGQPTKLGDTIMISTVGGVKFISPINGEYVQAPRFTPGWNFITEGDTIAFRISALSTEYDSSSSVYYNIYGITKYDKHWDSIWAHNVRFKFPMRNSGQQSIDQEFKIVTGNIINIYQTDKIGGLFFAYGTSSGSNGVQLRWVNENGSHFSDDEVIIPVSDVGIAFNGIGRYGIYDIGTGTAQVIDTTGKLLWPDTLKIISDPSNAYSPWGTTDNNGGGIIIYWTVLGGIYAQHTGRVGKVGIITKVPTDKNIPFEFELNQNYPNPFNPSTKIQFTINNSQWVVLKIFDVLGREIQTLVNEKLQHGKYEVQWDASRVTSGTYFYTLTLQNKTITKKMILLR